MQEIKIEDSLYYRILLKHDKELAYEYYQMMEIVNAGVISLNHPLVAQYRKIIKQLLVNK